MPVTINARMLMLAIGVNRLTTSFISLLCIGDSKAAFAPGRITRRIITIPPIHTTVAKMWEKWHKLNMSIFILHLSFVMCVNQIKGWVFYCLPPPLLKILVQLPLTSWMRSSTPASSFFNWSLYSSSLSCSSFTDMKRRKNVPHPHPQQPQVHPQASGVDWVPLGLHIFITPFLWVVVYIFSLLPKRLNTKKLIKYFSSNLINKIKKFTCYFGVAISLILSRTVLSSICNSFSYFLSDSKLVLFNTFSLNLPVPRHPQVHTSFKICRQFSNASSSMEYGIQYPFLSLLTRPDCLNIFRCCDTAAGVMPTSSAILFAPRGPLDFKRSIILTRVSTANTLNISAGANFIFLRSYLIKYFSIYLINIIKERICQTIF